MFLRLPCSFRQHAIGIDAKQRSCRPPDGGKKQDHESSGGMGRTKGRIVKPGFLSSFADGTDQDRKKNRQRNKPPRQHTGRGLADDDCQGSAVCPCQENAGGQKEERNRGQKRRGRVSASGVEADQVVRIGH